MFDPMIFDLLTPPQGGGPKQVAQGATITLLGASIMFGDTIINDAHRQLTLNLKQ